MFSVGERGSLKTVMVNIGEVCHDAEKDQWVRSKQTSASLSTHLPSTEDYERRDVRDKVRVPSSPDAVILRFQPCTQQLNVHSSCGYMPKIAPSSFPEGKVEMPMRAHPFLNSKWLIMVDGTWDVSVSTNISTEELGNKKKKKFRRSRKLCIQID